MVLELAGKALVNKIVSKAVDALSQRIPLGNAGKSKVITDNARDALTAHVEMVNVWAAEISFRDMWQSKEMKESFVELELHLGHRRLTSRDSLPDGFTLIELVGRHKGCVILGDPGAGKTTSIKRLALFAVQSYEDGADTIPILIRLRDLEEKQTIVSALQTALGIQIVADPTLDSTQVAALKLRVVSQYLDRMHALLLIDGLDELPPSSREGVLSELRYFFLHARDYQVVMTCRTGDFVYHIEHSEVFTIQPLSPEQIEEFTFKWLGPQKGPKFLSEISANPYAGTEVRPLTLAHLCAIYERSNAVPEKPRTVYRKIVRLLLEDWDEQRSVRRYSKYANFEVDRKEDFLKAIAFHLTRLDQRGSFSHAHLQQAYREVYDVFGLPEQESERVAREVESHTGLIVESAFEEYEFAHKSLQEYLTAEYILRLPKIPKGQLLDLPDEMALAVSLSSEADQYFISVAKILLSDDDSHLRNFTEPFIRRLVVEKADFRDSEELGWAVLGLYSATYYRFTGGQLELPFLRTYSDFLSFIKSKKIFTSLEDAVSGAEITEIGGDLYEVTPSWTEELDQEWTNLLGMWPDRKLTVDRILLDELGVSKD